MIKAFKTSEVKLAQMDEGVGRAQIGDELFVKEVHTLSNLIKSRAEELLQSNDFMSIARKVKMLSTDVRSLNEVIDDY